MDEDRGKELFIAPPPEGDGMSHATSKYRYARRFRTAGERRAEMSKYIRVPLTEEMEKDYRECAEMMENGQEKNCEECSLNGGS